MGVAELPLWAKTDHFFFLPWGGQNTPHRVVRPPHTSQGGG